MIYVIENINSQFKKFIYSCRAPNDNITHTNSISDIALKILSGGSLNNRNQDFWIGFARVNLLSFL